MTPGPAEPLPAGVSDNSTGRSSEAKTLCVVADCAQLISVERRAAGYRTCAAHYLEEPQ
jgi:hypothetical protein